MSPRALRSLEGREGLTRWQRTRRCQLVLHGTDDERGRFSRALDEARED